MRRDICHYYPASVKAVFNAYVAAINNKFGKGCTTTGLVKIEFGLGFSFRYNMNGGACTLHLMPYGQGTAVNVRYSIAQLAGARYGAHAKAMQKCVEQALGVRAQDANIDVNEFLKYAQSSTASAPAPKAPTAPAPAAAPAAPTRPASEDVPAMLREYKRLLDDGVISQAEFDAKKKQLLGL